MAQVDTSMWQNIRQPDVTDTFGKLLALQQMKLNMQNQQAVAGENAIRMRQLAQAESDQNAVRQAYASGDPQTYLQKTAPHLVPQYNTSQLNMQKEQLAIQEQLGKIDGQTLGNLKTKNDLIGQTLLGLKSVDPAQRATVYPALKQQAVQSGLVAPNDPNVPDQYPGDQWLDAHLAQHQTVDQFLNREIQNRELTAKLPGIQAESQIKQAEANAMQQGAVPNNVADMQYRQIQQKKAMGQQLTAGEAASAKAYELQKTIGPRTTFALNMGAGMGNAPLNPSQQATVQAILDGRMAPPSSFALRTPYWQMVMGSVFQQDPQFNEQRAQLRKAYTVGTQSKEINAINTAMGHVGVLGDSIDALNNGNIKALNSIANQLGVQTGKDAVTTFNTIVHRVGPELSKAYIGAGGSAGERGADEKDFDPSLGPQQLRSNVAMTAKLLRSKISSLENQWNQNAPAGQDFESRFIMPEAQSQLDKWAPKAGGSTKSVPAGAVGIAPGSDGKNHYHDAKGNDLGVAP